MNVPIDQKYIDLLTGHDFHDTLLNILGVVVTHLCDTAGLNQEDTKHKLFTEIEQVMPCQNVPIGVLVSIALTVLSYFIRDFDSYAFMDSQLHEGVWTSLPKKNRDTYRELIVLLHQNGITINDIYTFSHQLIQFCITKNYPLYPHLQLVRWFMPCDPLYINKIPRQATGFPPRIYAHAQLDITVDLLDTHVTGEVQTKNPLSFQRTLESLQFCLKDLVLHEMDDFFYSSHEAGMHDHLHPIFYLLRRLQYTITVTPQEIIRVFNIEGREQQ